MTSATLPLNNQPISNSRATITRQSLTAATRIGPPDSEAWTRRYEWEGAELPERCLACYHPRSATASIDKPE